MYGTRTSLFIGLVGVTLSLVLGITLGGISGYLWRGDRHLDPTADRDYSFDSHDSALDGPGCGAAREWSVRQVYFAITIIISFIGWTELARVVRGRFLSLREEDFVTAAELAGCSQMRIIFRHMVPSFLSHIIAAATLAIAGHDHQRNITQLPRLGPPPAGCQLGGALAGRPECAGAGDLALAGFPVIPVIIVILALNFLGDGLRDAADPYG